MKLIIDDHAFEVDIAGDTVRVDGQPFRVTVDGFGATRIVNVNGRPIRVDLGAAGGESRAVTVEGKTMTARMEGSARARPAARSTISERPAAAATPTTVKGAIAAQMTGRVVRVAVQAGEVIAAGDLLLILEAMKMENEVRSPRGGTIKEVCVVPGDRVAQGSPLVVLDE